MKSPDPHAFKTKRELDRWMKVNHAQQSELWVRIFKKDSGIASVTWDDCVVVAIAWGWIDGQKKAFDDVSFLQRLSPRRAKSNWSKRNCVHAERLIEEGRMQPPGLAHVLAARQDGRWESAYAGSKEMVIPDDFLDELRKVPAAKRFFETLDRKNLFAIYHRLHTAKRVETREKRIASMIDQLKRGVAFH